MLTTATTEQPDTALNHREREVLRAVGRGLTDAEIAAEIAVPEGAVAGRLDRILGKLGLRDRAAAIVHAFDCGLVVPGQGPRRPDARLRISVLGPLRAWRDGRPLDLGPVRQQAVLAALALCPDRVVSQQELRDGVWGLEPPAGNVVPVYVYRLRKILDTGDGRDSVIRRDRCGYRFAGDSVELDVTKLERLVTAAEAADEPAEVVRACTRALDLFRGEPLAGLPGPFAELERMRLADRRIALAQRKLDWQQRMGHHAEAVAELSALAAAQPENEPVAAMLMRALYRSGRRSEALAVFTRTRRLLADDLGLSPGETLRQAHQAVLRGDETSFGRTRTGAVR
ncbi:BTAD domain-containing putative transcriptional regulator [Amycolatopsis minnesotensis]|uniref:Transcriptional regulator n=1 Tax=Amycolatopsis minnesotensis TaxID=337894 RepID=A0ABP5E131_9PSEU